MSNVKVSNTRRLVVIAMLSAIAIVIYYLDFPVPLMPSFIKLDLSNVISLIAAFALGPISGVSVCFIKNLVHLLIKGLSTTYGIGDIFDFVTSAVFALVAGLIYLKMKNKKGALIGCAVGTAVYSAISLPLNLFIVYPIYAAAFGGMDAIVGMYKEILPSIDSLFGALAIFNLPFTLIKGILCSVVTIIIYKPLSPVIKGRK